MLIGSRHDLSFLEQSPLLAQKKIFPGNIIGRNVVLTPPGIVVCISLVLLLTLSSSSFNSAHQVIGSNVHR